MSVKIINATIFTGETVLENASIGIINGKFTDDLYAQFETEINYNGDWLVPGFIDLQLYGGNGQLFSDKLSVESLKATYQYSLAGGATTILPTIATNSWEVIFKGIDTIREYQQQGLPGIPGMHLEGPFINPLKRGAHLQQHIIQPTIHLAKELVDKSGGIIKIITLAPECCSDEVLDIFLSNGIIVSAGHSNATMAEANHAFGKGVKLVTHLFNAMSPLNHREPGLAGATMMNENIMSSIVPDGYHVNFEMVKLAKKMMGERLFIITDAVTGTGGDYQHQLDSDKYILPDGTLSGSALTMIKAVHNCIEKASITAEEVFRMASLYPAKAMGMHHDLGKIKAGYTADFLRLDKNKQLLAVYKNAVQQNIVS